MKPLRSVLAAVAAAAFWYACSADPPPPACDPWPPKPCQTVEDCPAALTHLCGMRSCVDGFCKLDIYTQSRSDVRGDCHVDMCDNFGSAEARPDLEDFKDDGNPCTRDYCEERGNQVASHNASLEAGPVPNGSGYCNGQGKIVDCLIAENCADPSLTCSRFGFFCVPLACANEVRDESAGETGRDCGGPCDGCLEGDPCHSDADCLSGVCGDDNRCAYETCKDGVKNRTETDVDCGGSYCGPCTDGQGCRLASDCVNKVCFTGECQPRTCDDGMRNGDEEDIDCGADCPPCQF